MKTQFFIALNIKTSNGLDNIARFRIGNNRDRAYGIFYLLKGDHTVNETNVLCLDFMEMKNGLPVNVRMITCTLDQLAENCKIITKEVFKLFNLENTQAELPSLPAARSDSVAWPDRQDLIGRYSNLHRRPAGDQGGQDNNGAGAA